VALRGVVLRYQCPYTRDGMPGGARVARAGGMAVSRATGLYLHTKGGVILALGIVLLLTALGLAIGITTVGDPRAAIDQSQAGVWTQEIERRSIPGYPRVLYHQKWP
jgi:hypothetical protein